jgi:poly [ADP-ribose] polymerase
MYEPVHLLMITTNNNNKYYDMNKISDNEWEARYGRVGTSPQIRRYSLSLWDKKYREKIAKGYKDMSDMVEEAIEKEKPSGPKEYEEIKNKAIADIVEKLQNLARKTVSENYKVNASVVTQKMVDTAQELLDNLVGFKGTVNEFNDKLLELFTIIPRKMHNVNEYLVNKKSDFDEKIAKESDILNSMRSQVYIKDVTEDVEESEEPLNKGTILEALGIEIEDVTDVEINMIKDLMNESKDKFKKAWRVTNKKTQKRFDDFVEQEKIKDTRLLFHGSRSENFWSILQTGLVLRPTNAVITGKMFGYGIYYSPHCQKSIGYTSLNGSYWARGNNNTAYMALFDVAYGTPYDVYDFDSKYYNLNYNELQKFKQGAHCLHAHKDKGMLRNDEIVVYKEEQITIKYLIEIGY